jgi:hypothetical protein
VALTKSFNALIRAQLQEDAGFRRGYLQQAVTCMFGGDVDTGKLILRKYINGTIGFVKLGEALGKSSKTLMQMLGPKGNPHIRNFFEIVAYLQKAEGTVVEIVFKNAA